MVVIEVLVEIVVEVVVALVVPVRVMVAVGRDCDCGHVDIVVVVVGCWLVVRCSWYPADFLGLQAFHCRDIRRPYRKLKRAKLLPH